MHHHAERHKYLQGREQMQGSLDPEIGNVPGCVLDGGQQSDGRHKERQGRNVKDKEDHDDTLEEQAQDPSLTALGQ